MLFLSFARRQYMCLSSLRSFSATLDEFALMAQAVSDVGQLHS